MGKIKYSTYSLPNQECSYKEKLKPEWFIPTCNYIVDRATKSDDHSKIDEYLIAARGEVSDKIINKVLKPLSSDDPELKNIQIGTKRNVDLIKPIVRRYMGELIKQYTNFQVYLSEPTTILERNKNLDSEIDAIIVQMFVNEFNAQMGSGEQQSTPDIEEYVKTAETKFLTDETIKAQHRLNLILSETDEANKIIQAFFYWFATNRVITYRSIQNNDVVYEVIKPKEYFRVTSGNPYIKDDDMGCRIFTMTVNQIIEHYKDIIKPSDLTYLKEHNDINNNGVKESEILNRDVASVYELSTVLSGGSGQISATDFSRFITCYHTVIKTQRSIQILNYVDMFGEEHELQVGDDYTFDEANGDISLVKDSRIEFWEIYRFGGELEGVYSIPQPCEVQRHLFNNNSYCENPYNGMYGLLEDFSELPIPYSLSDINAMNMILLIQIERTIAKFKPGITIIPERLLQDSPEYKMEQRIAGMTLDDWLIINDEEVDANILQATKQLTNPTVERYIEALFNIRKQLKEEAYEIADMTPSRMGINSPYAGKATTEMSINYSIAGSVLLFEKFNKFREKDYETLIDCARLAWSGGKDGTFVDTEGSVINLRLNVDDNLSNNGVFVRNNAIENEKMQQLKGFGQAAMQSGDLAVASKIITSNNSTEIDRFIQEYTKATQEFKAKIEADKNATMQQINDANLADKEVARNHESNLTILKEQAETERTMLTLNSGGATPTNAIDSFKASENANKANLEARKLNLAERAQTNKEISDKAKLNFNEKKLANDRYIASINKN